MDPVHDDIDDVVHDWAWDYFRRKCSSEEKKLLDRELIHVAVDWKRVRFVHSPPRYEPEPPTPGGGVPLNNPLFSTTFTNRTGSPQTYTFRAHRTTRSTCSVQVERGYTRSASMEVRIAYTQPRRRVPVPTYNSDNDNI